MSDATRQRHGIFAQGLRAHRRQHWTEAAFSAIVEQGPQGPAALYLARINRFRDAPPPADRDGVHRALDKEGEATP